METKFSLGNARTKGTVKWTHGTLIPGTRIKYELFILVFVRLTKIGYTVLRLGLHRFESYHLYLSNFRLLISDWLVHLSKILSIFPHCEVHAHTEKINAPMDWNDSICKQLDVKSNSQIRTQSPI